MLHLYGWLLWFSKKKCPFECNIENCLRCTDDGQKCIACKQNFDPSTEGLCIPLRILSSCEDESSVTDEGVCTPSCGLPFTCAKEKSGSWACVHPRCVKIINGEKQVCGLKGTCTRAGSCICDDPHTWDFLFNVCTRLDKVFTVFYLRHTRLLPTVL